MDAHGTHPSKESQHIAELVAQAVAAGTARVTYTREQDFATLLSAAADDGQDPPKGLLRRVVKKSLGSKVRDLVDQLKQFSGSGTMDFVNRRCLLDCGGLLVLLDGNEVYMGGPDKWEGPVDTAREFLGIGGPFWLLDVLNGITEVRRGSVPADEGSLFVVCVDVGKAEAAIGRELGKRAPGEEELTLSVVADANQRLTRVDHTSASVGGRACLELSEHGTPDQVLAAPTT